VDTQTQTVPPACTHRVFTARWALISAIVVVTGNHTCRVLWKRSFKNSETTESSSGGGCPQQHANANVPKGQHDFGTPNHAPPSPRLRTIEKTGGVKGQW
jgi:hypothetical protein